MVTMKNTGRAQHDGKNNIPIQIRKIGSRNVFGISGGV